MMNALNKIIYLSLLIFAANVKAMPVTFMPLSPIDAPLTDIYGQYSTGGPYTGSSQPVDVDINFDGVNDLFLINNRYNFLEQINYPGEGEDYSYSLYYERSHLANMSSTGAVEGTNVFFAGNLIGPDSSSWTNSGLYWETEYTDDWCDVVSGVEECYYDQGGWGGGPFYTTGTLDNRYIGFSFLIDGAEHFGWADINISEGAISLNRWGWETEVGAGILAGAGIIVPLPPALWMFGFGLISLLGLGRARSNSNSNSNGE